MKPPDLERKKRVIARETILKQGEQLMAELASSRALLGTYLIALPAPCCLSNLEFQFGNPATQLLVRLLFSVYCVNLGIAV